MNERSAALPTDGRARWLVSAAAALALISLLTSQLYVWVRLFTIRLDWPTALLWALPQILVWALLIGAIVQISARVPLRPERWALPALFHAAAAIGCALLAIWLVNAADRLLHWTTLLGAPGHILANPKLTLINVHIGVAIYSAVLAAEHAVRFYGALRERELRASRLEAELAGAQLHALRMQLNPHFLFNTLNSIGVLIRHDVTAAEEMLHRLSELLHATLEHGGTQEVPLADELAYLRSYLAIEQRRFRDRLHVEYDVPADTLSCSVPFLVLQPLVENAVRHGIARRLEGGTIALSAERVNGSLLLRVADRGPSAQGGAAATGHGIGLSNVRRRLERLYGAAGGVDLSLDTAAGTVATVMVPWRLES